MIVWVVVMGVGFVFLVGFMFVLVYWLGMCCVFMVFFIVIVVI